MSNITINVTGIWEPTQVSELAQSLFGIEKLEVSTFENLVVIHPRPRDFTSEATEVISKALQSEVKPGIEEWLAQREERLKTTKAEKSALIKSISKKIKDLDTMQLEELRELIKDIASFVCE